MYATQKLFRIYFKLLNLCNNYGTNILTATLETIFVYRLYSVLNQLISRPWAAVSVLLPKPLLEVRRPIPKSKS